MPPSGNASSGVFLLPEPGLKLLFDENLAPRLATALADLYPGSAHVRDVGLAGKADFAVWEGAGAGGFLLVSKDEDFHRLSVLRGFPPKVVWIRLGNCSTSAIEQLLRKRFKQLAEFAAHEEAAFLALG